MKKTAGIIGLVLLLLISGCGSEKTPSQAGSPGTKQAEETEKKEAEQEDAEQEDAEQEDTEQEDTEQENAITLEWALFDFRLDMSAREEALNEALKNKGYPYEIEFVDIPVDFDGDYQAYVNTYLEEVKEKGYDIINCAGIMNCYDFYQMAVAREMLYPLDEFLEGDGGSQLKAAYPGAVWEAAREKGHIYGVPTPYTDFKFYAVFNLDYVEKYGLELSDLTLDGLEELLEKVKLGEEGEGNKKFVASASLPWLPAGEEYSICDLAAILEEDGKPVAENFLDNDACLAQIRRLNEWGDRGLLSTGGDYWPQIERGNFLMFGTYSYSGEAAENKYRGAGELPSDLRLQAVELPEFEHVFYESRTKMGINAEGKNREAAMEVLAAVYSDAELSNALVYGKEGRDYQIEDGQAVRLGDQQSLEVIVPMTLGNPFITAPSVTDSRMKNKELWETVDAMTPSVLTGFRFDMSGIGPQVSQINTLFQEEYNECFFGGSDDLDKDLKELREKAEALGIDEVLLELDRQLAEKE